MKTVKNNFLINFESFDSTNKPVKNTASFVINENPLCVEKLVFLRPIYAIKPTELTSIDQQIFNIMKEFEIESEKTVGNPDNLPATTQNLQMVTNFQMVMKKKGISGAKEFLEMKVNDLDKKGSLTNDDRSLAKSAFDVIDRLLGNKKKG